MKGLSILLLVILIGCQQKQESADLYTDGIPIEHANEFRTTKQSFGFFNLHSWMHDTLYRHSGFELQIEPMDSTLEFEVNAHGAHLMQSSDNKYKFLLDPTDSIVILTLVWNGKDAIRKRFISPYLPPPSLAKEVSEDSVRLSLTQTETRLRRLLPMDTRYGFNSQKGPSETILTSKDDLEINNLEAIRINYRNRIYPVEIKK